MENWRPIKGYPHYEVSDLGRVRSVGFTTHVVQKNREYDLYCKGKIIKPLSRRHGYLSVFLYYEGGRTQESVHRLVAEAFCEHPVGKDEVNHKNEIKTDNRACNLEWVTHKENCHHGTAIERRREKSINGKRSRPINQYDLDGNYIRTFPSFAEATRQGFNQANVYAAIHGGCSQAYGYKWGYADTVS